MLKFFTLFLFISVIFSKNHSFTFPKQWQAIVNGYVHDILTNGKDIQSAGWYYADYALGAQRADEVWNITTLQDTDLVALGIFADTHLFLKTQGYFYYTNSSGTQCAPQPSSLVPQIWPSSTFKGKVIFEKADALKFSFDFDGGTLSLFTNEDSNFPLGLETKFTQFNLTSLSKFVTFDTANFSSSQLKLLFTPPSYCS